MVHTDTHTKRPPPTAALPSSIEPFPYRKRQRFYQSKHEIDLIRRLECCIEDRHVEDKYVDWALDRLATWSSFDFQVPTRQELAMYSRPQNAILLLQKVDGLFDMLLETLALFIVSGSSSSNTSDGSDRMDEGEEDTPPLPSPSSLPHPPFGVDFRQFERERRALLALIILRNMSFMKLNQQVMVASSAGTLFFIIVRILLLNTQERDAVDAGPADVSTLPRFLEFKVRAMELLANLANSLRFDLALGQDTEAAMQTDESHTVEDGERREGEREELSDDKVVVNVLQQATNAPVFPSMDAERDRAHLQLRLSAVEALNAILTFNRTVYVKHMHNLGTYIVSMIQPGTIDTICRIASDRIHKEETASNISVQNGELTDYEMRLTMRSFAVNILHNLARISKDNHDLYSLVSKRAIPCILKLLMDKYHVEEALSMDVKQRYEAVTGVKNGTAADEDEDEYIFSHVVPIENTSGRQPRRQDQTGKKTAFKELCVRILLNFTNDPSLRQYDDAIAKLIMVAGRSRHARCEQLLATLLSELSISVPKKK